ncbi:unnamed protein product [Rodentolepis nana]|uniref:Dynein regulatory complex protein 9 n=1 Tax=Rodentolepis nana TaxID=102285 RepID=A0A0R3TJJ0_RODNA|nr:unnamed protein product [Rodentolepis nana]
MKSSPVHLIKWNQHLNLNAKELKLQVPQEIQLWSDNVENAIAEESARQQKKESDLRAEIDQISADIDIAIKAQSKINTWIIDNNGILEAEIENITEKHKREYAALRKKTAELTRSRNEQLEALTTLKDEYEKMEKVVTDYQNKIKTKEQEERREKELDEAAAMIQAWWRAIIVVKKIITNKPKKRKKAKGAKKRKSK